MSPVIESAQAEETAFTRSARSCRQLDVTLVGPLPKEIQNYGVCRRHQCRQPTQRRRQGIDRLFGRPIGASLVQNERHGAGRGLARCVPGRGESYSRRKALIRWAKDRFLHRQLAVSAAAWSNFPTGMQPMGAGKFMARGRTCRSTPRHFAVERDLEDAAGRSFRQRTSAWLGPGVMQMGLGAPMTCARRSPVGIAP